VRIRRISVTGANGQLGQALRHLFEKTATVDALARPAFDLTDWRSTRDRIVAFRPDLLIHTGAATDVDACELDPTGAFSVNALGTRHVAAAAAMCGAELVYVSTNYVFDGTKESPYHEFDPVNPISVYGASKLAGERDALNASNRCHVVRTAWLYSEVGRNYALTMRRLMQERDSLTVVADQRGNPTYAGDLAQAIRDIVELAPYGIHHVVNSGNASWFEWAGEIAHITGAATKISPIPASEWQRPARAPANGVLTSLSLPAAGIALPDWRDALRRCLAT